jgi:RNA polymerase sigma-70 factor (ECF subfamily)
MKRDLIRQILREEFLMETEASESLVDFQTIYSKMWDKMVRSVCLKYTKDLNKAEDFCQNGFMKVYKNLHKYKGGGSLEGWVRRVIQNSVLDELRKRKIEFSSEEPDWSRVDHDDEPYEEKYSVEMIEDVLSDLSPAYKQVFEMYYFRGMTHKQIANKLGISDGTSKSNLSKAKIKVRKLIAKKFNV